MDEALSPGRTPDRETFQRVWDRVMPGAGEAPEPPPEPLSPAIPGPLPPPALPRKPAEEILMDLAARRAAACRTLSRRGGPESRVLSAMAADCRKAYCRLSTARFLITGQRYCPAAVPPHLPAGTDRALRGRWLECVQWQQLCEKAARDTDQPMLARLFLQLAREGAGHAGALRALLEQRCPPP